MAVTGRGYPENRVSTPYVAPPFPPHILTAFTTAGSYSYTPPPGCLYVDVVLLGLSLIHI